MTIKHIQIITLWIASVLSLLLAFLSGNTLFGDTVIRVLLSFFAFNILLFAAFSSNLLLKGSKPSFYDAFRVLGVIGSLANLFVLFKAAFTVDGYWTEEINGIFFVCAGVSFVFVLFNYLHTSERSLENKNQAKKPEVSDLLFIIAVPMFIAGFGIYSLYNQETSSSSVGEPDYTLQPSSLMDAFEKDAATANQQYIGKVIRFSGSVAEIGGDSSILLTLNAWKEGYGVNCDFDIALKEKLSAVLQGDSVLLQCSCSGLSAPEEGMSLLSETSLEMTRCALIENFKNSPNLGTDVEHPKVTPKKKPE
ncbi:MAG: OB-fold protein [Sphingomonadales bacterium]